MGSPGDAGLKKRYRAGLWNRYFLSNLGTRLAKPWTTLFVALRLSPNAVSVLSFLLALAGMALVAFGPGPVWTRPVGGALLILSLIWDHSDGQVARLTGKGSPQGALFDTILDRWVEAGWVLAIGLGVLVDPSATTTRDWPAWLVLLFAVGGAHTTLYVRWSNVQRDLYNLQRELKAARAASKQAGVIRFNPEPHHTGVPPVRTFYIPFAFNRDVSMWMLLAVTVSPDWVMGLGAFALLHALLGLEKNWYAFRDLGRGDSRAIAALLDPDYHK